MNIKLNDKEYQIVSSEDIKMELDSNLLIGINMNELEAIYFDGNKRRYSQGTIKCKSHNGAYIIDEIIYRTNNRLTEELTKKYKGHILVISEKYDMIMGGKDE